MKEFKLGTVSHGTLRTQDLIKAFANELVGLGVVLSDTHKEEIEYVLTTYTEGREYSFNEGVPEFVLYELIEELERAAPLYCYFGTTEGDGSDFGFWVDHDAVQDAIDNYDVPAFGTDFSSLTDHAGPYFLRNLSGDVCAYGVCYSGVPHIIWQI